MSYRVTYDPAAPFPQQPMAGRGISLADGTHSDPPNLASFLVDESVLVHGDGNDQVERFYDVVAGPALQAKPQAEVDALRLNNLRAERKRLLREIAERKRTEALNIERLEQLLSQIGRALSTLTKIAEGHVASTGYDPVADGVVTGGPNSDVSFMRAVRDKGDTLQIGLQAEQDIEDEIDSAADAGSLPDADAIQNDPRWP